MDPQVEDVVQKDVGEERADRSSYNLAKLPFELGTRIQRERLRPGYGDGFHGAPLVVWRASGDKTPEDGGADAPARQDATPSLHTGEP